MQRSGSRRLFLCLNGIRNSRAGTYGYFDLLGLVILEIKHIIKESEGEGKCRRRIRRRTDQQCSLPDDEILLGKIRGNT